jgi:hypothetical protein
VLDDATLRRTLGARGRETVERLYSWDVIGRSMTAAYLEAARAWSGAPASVLPFGSHAHLSHG